MKSFETFPFGGTSRRVRTKSRAIAAVGTSACSMARRMACEGAPVTMIPSVAAKSGGWASGVTIVRFQPCPSERKRKTPDIFSTLDIAEVGNTSVTLRTLMDFLMIGIVAS